MGIAQARTLSMSHSQELYEYVADLITKFGSFRSTRLLLARFDTRMEEGSVLSASDQPVRSDPSF
jgi:hypothetical protein